ncbi:MAG TPA: cupin domain-containing protein [Anaerolineae bacterium]|nr:cupin domain-containing protein [Anaerolineae bacterium]HQK14574.1 cupin domain-containing protein [Anaerolineae bacterium]
MDDFETPWEPEPLDAETFHQGTWVNINRAPYDRISGVIYKRAPNIKRVRYHPADAAPPMPEPWQGSGEAVVRWLFSELSGTEEGLLRDATFAFLHDLTLAPGAASGQKAHPGLLHIYYVVSGMGMLYHRPTDGSPVIARPLRPGDAVLVHGDEYHNVANATETDDLRLIVLGLYSGSRVLPGYEASIPLDDHVDEPPSLQQAEE